MKLGKKEHFSHWEWGRHSAPKTRAPPKIGKNKIFWRKIVRPGYCLFLLCKRNTTHKIPGTSVVYWVA
jgi:hypothetical protein